MYQYFYLQDNNGTSNISEIVITYVPTATITLNAACTDGEMVYGTYSNTSAWVVPEDLIVSEVGITDGKLNVAPYSTGAVVPANTGVMVSALEGGDYTVELSTETGTSVLDTDNALKPSGAGITAEGMAAAAPDCIYYRLTMHNGETIGYAWGAKDGAAFALAANKAYLAVPNSLGAKVSLLWFDGEVTGIENVNTDMKNGAIYNLAGQRVNKVQNGIFIMNGKKYIAK